jgi:hypothetical protein
MDKLRRFTELEARNYVISRLGDDFHFMEEVAAKDILSDKKYRLDAVSMCEATNHLLGWEFKKSHLLKSEFVGALKQAADYRSAKIDDPRFPGINGQQIEACIVFPDWDGLHGSGRLDYPKEAKGMRLLAFHFRVGTLSLNDETDGLHMIMGEQPIWHSYKGWTDTAKGILRGKRRKGSGKAFDS